jgi:hypothetical protein
MVQPLQRPRWFEEENNISFQFKLTPRGKGGSAPASAAIPKANEDGFSGPTSAPADAPMTTSRGGVHELGTDDTAWQRLLTSTLFLIKEDSMPLKAGESKVLDLGLVSSRQSGGKHLAMKHQSSKEHEENMFVNTDAAKRIRWKVVVKPVKRTEKGGLLPR